MCMSVRACTCLYANVCVYMSSILCLQLFKKKKRKKKAEFSFYKSENNNNNNNYCKQNLLLSQSMTYHQQLNPMPNQEYYTSLQLACQPLINPTNHTTREYQSSHTFLYNVRLDLPPQDSRVHRKWATWPEAVFGDGASDTVVVVSRQDDRILAWV